MEKLEGKVALVTAASKEVGASIAENLGSRGRFTCGELRQWQGTARKEAPLALKKEAENR